MGCHCSVVRCVAELRVVVEEEGGAEAALAPLFKVKVAPPPIHGRKKHLMVLVPDLDQVGRPLFPGNSLAFSTLCMSGRLIYDAISDPLYASRRGKHTGKSLVYR